jgi:hypothetical protein
MSKNLWTIALVSAIFAVVAMWSTPGFPATRPAESPQVAIEDLNRLEDLDVALRRALHAEQQHLDDGCEFAAIRERLIRVQEAAVRAMGRLGTLYRDGRLRDGGFAMSEVLVYQFAAVIDEARRDTALADTLAVLYQQTLDGAPDARERLVRMTDIHPAPPACLIEALDGAERPQRVSRDQDLSIEPTTLTVRPAR